MVAPKNSMNSTVVQKMEIGTRHDEFWTILLKFDLRVYGKISFLIF